jgi:hypothetical protein
MKKLLQNIKITFALVFIAGVAFAGNPDRQGEAGASELLINPWAGSSGIHTLNTASISGIEAMRLNIAGLSRIERGEFAFSNARLFDGTGMAMNALGYATKIGSNSAFGVSLASLSFGDIPVTTVAQPEGTGGNFSPNFFHIGLGFSHIYENRISVGVLVRGVSESLSDVSAFGFAIDAGVQYVSGERDEFKLGLSLRNNGSPMEFGGEGLSFSDSNVDPQVSGNEYSLTFNQRAEDFEMPSVLNIGLSYDFYLSDENYVRTIANFTSNAFSRDEIGIGAEFSFRDLIILRGAYRTDLGSPEDGNENVYTGVAAGASLKFGLKKGSANKISLDYAYRTTNPFKGTHNIGLRFAF